MEAGAARRRPGRALDTPGRPLPVRAYYAINRRLPVFRDALFGRGAIVLSRAAGGPGSTVPRRCIADDLFLDSLFEVGEKREVRRGRRRRWPPRAAPPT